MLEGFVALGNLVWIKPEADQGKTKGGIVIPEASYTRKSNIGTIIKIGSKVESYLIKLYGIYDIAVGDKVVYDYFQTSEYKINDNKILAVNPIYIIAKIEND